MFKLAAAGTVTAVVGHFVTDLALEIAWIAAGTAGIGYLVSRVVVPVVQMVKKAAHAYDQLEGMPDTIVGMDARIQALEHRSVESSEALAALMRELGVPHRHIDEHRPSV